MAKTEAPAGRARKAAQTGGSGPGAGSFLGGLLLGGALSAVALAVLSLGVGGGGPQSAAQLDAGGSASASPDAEAALMAPIASAPSPQPVAAPEPVAAPVAEAAVLAESRTAPEPEQSPASPPAPASAAAPASTAAAPSVSASDGEAPAARVVEPAPASAQPSPRPEAATPAPGDAWATAQAAVESVGGAASLPRPAMPDATPVPAVDAAASAAAGAAPSDAAPPDATPSEASIEVARANAVSFAPSAPDAALIAVVLTAADATDVDLEALKGLGAPLTLAFPLRSEDRARAARGAGFEVLARLPARDAPDALGRLDAFPAAGLAITGALSADAARELAAKGLVLLSESDPAPAPGGLAGAPAASPSALLEILRAAERRAAAEGRATVVLPASAAAARALGRWLALPRLAEPAPFSAAAASRPGG